MRKTNKQRVAAVIATNPRNKVGSSLSFKECICYNV